MRNIVGHENYTTDSIRTPNGVQISRVYLAQLPEKFETAIPQFTAKEALALGAAAIVASPRPVSRRGFLGLRWKLARLLTTPEEPGGME